VLVEQLVQLSLEERGVVSTARNGEFEPLAGALWHALSLKCVTCSPSKTGQRNSVGSISSTQGEAPACVTMAQNKKAHGRPRAFNNLPGLTPAAHRRMFRPLFSANKRTS
jgi:hypothetical protein